MTHETSSPTVDLTEPDAAGRVTLTLHGTPADVGETIRAVVMSGWPVPSETPDDLIPNTGVIGAVPLPGMIGRLTLALRTVGPLPPSLGWLLRRLNVEIAALSRECICGAPRWSWCRSSTGAPTSAHAFRRATRGPGP